MSSYRCIEKHGELIKEYDEIVKNVGIVHELLQKVKYTEEQKLKLLNSANRLINRTEEISEDVFLLSELLQVYKHYEDLEKCSYVH